MKTKEIFTTKKMTIEQNDFKNKFGKIKKLVKTDKYGFLQMNSKVSAIYNDSKKLKIFLNKIQESNDMMSEHIMRQVAKEAGADYDKMKREMKERGLN